MAAPGFAEDVAAPAPEKVDESDFTPEEKASLREALGKILDDPEVIASRMRLRAAAEQYKLELRRAVKRTSPELGSRVEEILIERLEENDKKFLIIRFRSFFKPKEEIPKELKERARSLFRILSKDGEILQLREKSSKTRDVGERSMIYGAMRARVAEIVAKEDPELFKLLLPLP